jgi:hypothetical protein
MGNLPSRISPRARVVCRSSEEPAFRKGRAHDRIVVAEVGRTASSSWTRAAPGNRGGVPKRNAARGNPRGASERPADGRRSGSSILAAIVTDRRGRVILAARSQTPPRFPMREGGSPPVGPRARGGQAERGDGSVRGCAVGRRRGKRTPASKSRNRLDPKCVGRRENAPCIRRAPRKGNTPPDHRTKTWVPVVEVSLAESWSHASLVDDRCVRREAWPQAAWERRRRLDLATE